MEEFDFSSLKRYEVVGDLMFNNQRVLLFYLCTEEEAKEFITMISGDFNTIT